MNKAGWLFGIFLSVFFTVFSFAQSSEKSILLNFDAAIEKAKPMKMSDFVSSVEYVPLETTEENLLPDFMSVGYVSEDYILYISGVPGSVRSPAYLFDRKGKFQNKIGFFGKGPQELVTGIGSGYVNAEKNRVVLFYAGHSRGVSWYDLSGNWLGDKKMTWEEFRDYVCGKGSTKYYSDYYPHFELTGTDDRVMIVDRNFDSTRVFTGPIDRLGDLDRVPGLFGTFVGGDGKFQDAEGDERTFKSAVYFPCFTQYSDHIGMYDLEGNRYGRFYYDGRAEFPYEVYCTKRNKVPVSGENNYRQCMFGWLETDRFCFIRLGAGASYSLIYDKQKDKLHALPTDALGLKDDMCCEEWWWPEGVTEDGLLYVRRSASCIKEQAEKSSNAKLKALAASLQEDDNDVLIFATPK